MFKGSLSGAARSGRCSCNAEMVESAELLSAFVASACRLTVVEVLIAIQTA